MSVTADALRELHRIHRQLADVGDRLARGPKQVRAGEANVRRLEEEVAAAKQLVQKTTIASDDKQLQLREREGRVEDLKRKLNSCASNREYQALVEQIHADETASSVLSDEILEMLERIDEYGKQVEEKAAVHKKAEEDSEKLRQRVHEEKQKLEGENVRLAGELEQAEAALPGDFRIEYKRRVEARGEDALAEVDGDSCGGCNQLITAQMLNELFLAKPLFCPSCGALMYLEEDRAVK